TTSGTCSRSAPSAASPPTPATTAGSCSPTRPRTGSGSPSPRIRWRPPTGHWPTWPPTGSTAPPCWCRRPDRPRTGRCRSGGGAGAVPLGGARPRPGRLHLAVAWRGRGDQAVQQLPGGAGDRVHRRRERLGVGRRRPGEPADLAHVLQGGGPDLLVGRRWREVVEYPDVPAHDLSPGRLRDAAKGTRARGKDEAVGAVGVRVGGPGPSALPRRGDRGQDASSGGRRGQRGVVAPAWARDSVPSSS